MTSDALHKVLAIDGNVTRRVLAEIHIFGGHFFNMDTLLITKRQLQEEVTITIDETVFASMRVFHPVMSMTTTGIYYRFPPKFRQSATGDQIHRHLRSPSHFRESEMIFLSGFSFGNIFLIEKFFDVNRSTNASQTV